MKDDSNIFLHQPKPPSRTRTLAHPFSDDHERAPGG